MRTPTFIAYASAPDTKDSVLSDEQEFLGQFLHAVVGKNVHPASIMLETDSDEVARRWPDPLAGLPPRLPDAMVPASREYAQYSGAIAFRRPAGKDEPIFAAIPIDMFANERIFAVPARAKLFAQQIRGRYVLIGGNIADVDKFQTPLSLATAEGDSHSTWGLDLVATMLAQELDGRLPHPAISNALLWVLALVTVASGGFTALLHRYASIFLLGPIAVLGAMPFFFTWRGDDTYGLPAYGLLIGCFLAILVVKVAQRILASKRRNLAQRALSRYLPNDIAAQIIRDPDWQRLKGERRAIFVLFSDLEGFTALTHRMEPEMVEFLLNRYLDILSGIVLLHGGTLDKFVGDAVVAFWGAPVSRPDDGRKAIEAAIAMHRAGEQFRSEAREGVPPIGRTRVGLHWGEAIVGNFGGEGRIQYTALGDPMNTAARLESANKQIGTSVLVSGVAAERSGLDIFRPLGRVVLSGRASPIEIYEPVPGIPAYERREFAVLAGKAALGDVNAIAAIATMAEGVPEDKALANFIFRLNNQKGAHYYVLESK